MNKKQFQVMGKLCLENKSKAYLMKKDNIPTSYLVVKD